MATKKVVIAYKSRRAQLTPKAVEVIQALDQVHFKLCELAKAESEFTLAEAAMIGAGEHSTETDPIFGIPTVSIWRLVDQAAQMALTSNGLDVLEANGLINHDRSAEFSGLKAIER